MRIGVISDIHSNILALEAVFKKFEEEKIDNVICLGDIIGIGPYPKKCIDFLIANKEKLLSIVRGNHEGYLLNGLPKTNHNIENGSKLSEEELDTHRWNHSRLNSTQVEFISKLNQEEIIEVENAKILVCHYPLKENGKFKKFYKNMDKERIEEIFNEEDIDIFLFGHTHKDCCFNENEKLVLNPGALGCPKGVNAALAGILNVEKNNIYYTQIAVDYDIDKVVEDIQKLKYPLSNFMIKTFYC